MNFDEFLKTKSTIDLFGTDNCAEFIKIHNEKTGYHLAIIQTHRAGTAGSETIFSLYKDGDDEETVASIIRKPYNDVNHEVEHETRASAEEAFDLAVKNDWLIVRSDLQTKLIVGWLEVRNSGTTYHSIRIMKLKGGR